jgi:hypothetical protein
MTFNQDITKADIADYDTVLMDFKSTTDFLEKLLVPILIIFPHKIFTEWSFPPLLAHNITSRNVS